LISGVVGPGEPGASTGIWSLSIFGGSPHPIRGDAEGAIVSPQQDKIAFAHYDDVKGAPEIWVMGINGEDPHALVRGEPRQDMGAIHWSPDGKLVLFGRIRPKTNGADVSVERIPVAGGKAEVMLSDPKLKDFLWTPRNTLVYAMNEPAPNDKDANLWEMPLSTNGAPAGEARKLTNWAGIAIEALSLTNDGHRLAFTRTQYQANIYATEFVPGNKVKAPVRMTSDEGRDIPSAWSADSTAFFFTSDRNGNNDIFKQTPGKDAEEFVLGPEQQEQPVLSPDGKSILYWSFPKPAAGEEPANKSLKRIPVAGGLSETVLTAGGQATLRCSSSAAARCVLSEISADRAHATFSTVDLAAGTLSPVANLELHPFAALGWSLSPAGDELAAVGFDQKKQTIRVFNLNGGATRDITVKNVVRVVQVEWMRDGSGFIVRASSLRTSVLAKVDATGEAHNLYAEDLVLISPTLSPDGKKMVFSSGRLNSNVWVVENF